jgi:hypothetical protein
MAISSKVCTTDSRAGRMGHKTVEYGTFTVVESDLEQWANLNHLGHVDTLLLQFGKVNSVPGVLVTAKKNVSCVSTAELTKGSSVSFIVSGGGACAVGDVFEFIAIGDIG